MSNPPSAKGGLSLYANLLNPSASTSSAPGTISSAPVVYRQPSNGDAQQDGDTAKKQLNAAALRFQPTKRPQIASQKPKPKTAFPKPVTTPVASSSPDAGTKAPPVPAALATQPAVKTSLADWTADDDDVNGFYAGEKRQRGGRKKRRKNKEAVVVQDWDDIYDPSRPNNFEEYKDSDEQFREIREWKERLYAHRTRRRHSSSCMSSDEEDRGRTRMRAQFAPPSSYSFAPPAGVDTADEPRDFMPSVETSDEATGDDAYARRMRLSGTQQQPASPPPPPPPTEAPAPPTADVPLPSAVPAPTISRAPVRYNLPSAPAGIPATEAELERALEQDAAAAAAEEEEAATAADGSAPRSNRPGQRGFAERLMAKYGWTKGTGLGATGSGIVNPLRVQVEKRKQRPDAEGGGFIGPGGKGKIIGGKRAKVEEGKFGAMSEVVVLFGMVDGLDLEREMVDGRLVEEIGEECTEKYGNVERVFIHWHSGAESVPVFVKFTIPLSALKAVNALDGRIFNGNAIRARFYDAEKFEKGIYE